MLAKKYRLPVQSVGPKKSRSVRGRYFLLRFFNSSLAYGRVAVVVSKKVCPKATMRNQLKRAVYDFFRIQPLAAGTDLIVSALTSAANPKTDKHAMLKELENIFIKK